MKIGGEVPTLKPGQGGPAVSRQVGIHSSALSACCDVTKAGTEARPKGARALWGGGTLQGLPRSG